MLRNRATEIELSKKLGFSSHLALSFDMSQNVRRYLPFLMFHVFNELMNPCTNRVLHITHHRKVASYLSIPNKSKINAYSKAISLR